MSISSEDLKRKYEGLLSLDKRMKWSKIAVGSMLLLIFVNIFVFINLDDVFNLPSYGFLIALILPIGIAFSVMQWSNRYILTTQQRILFEFCKADYILQTFTDLKTPNQKKKAKDIINDLAFYVGEWASSGPNSLNEIPLSIKNNLRNKIIPIIGNNKFGEISSFRNNLFNFLLRIYDKEPTTDDLKYLDERLREITVISEPTKFIESKKILQKYPQMKFIWLSPLGGGILGSVLYYIDPSQLHSTIAVSVPTAIIILVAIISWGRKKTK